MEKEAILKFINKQKSRHALTLKDGRVILGGETFEAELSLIPAAFRDMVTIVSAGEGAEAKARAKEGVSSQPVRRMQRLERKSEPGLIEELQKPIVEQSQKPIEKKEARRYKKKHVGGGKYNVLDEETGEKQNENPLTGLKAQQLIDVLTKQK